MWRVEIDPRFDKKEFGDFDTYLRMCEESDGFDVCRLMQRLPGGIKELPKFEPKAMQTATELAKFAVTQYNTRENSDLEFVNLLKANLLGVNGAFFYITLEARSPSLNQSNIYQAKVFTKGSNPPQLRLFQRRPHGYSDLLSWVFANPSSIPEGAVSAFRDLLSNLPELAKLDPRHIDCITTRKWNSMSMEEKVRCHFLKNLQFQDVAELVAATAPPLPAAVTDTLADVSTTCATAERGVEQIGSSQGAAEFQ